jgi:hypothetical protein
MPVLCLTLPRPGPQLRAVIIIVIYLASLPITALHPAGVVPRVIGKVVV